MNSLAFLLLFTLTSVNGQALTDEDFELAKTIDFKALVDQYERDNVTVELRNPTIEKFDFHERAAFAIWQGGIIPYEILPGFSANDRAGIANAIAYIQTHTCLRFSPLRSGVRSRDKMTFTPVNWGGFCYTTWSKEASGATTANVQLSVNSACTVARTVVHEIVHALGFFHTHTRFDRDNYVEIYKDFISANARNQYDICTGCCCDTWGFPYDCESVMHYAKNQFSTNGRDTMRAKVAGCNLLNFNEWQVHMPYFSPQDIDMIQNQYRTFC